MAAALVDPPYRELLWFVATVVDLGGPVLVPGCLVPLRTAGGQEHYQGMSDSVLAAGLVALLG